ncbi:MAG: putative sensor domain DACNV-containing protein [Bryobacteraceae bacterium]
MEDPAYPAARAVASRVHIHFSQQIAEERQRGTREIASVPDKEAIEAVIDAAFWASLRHQERYSPKISIALLSPGQARLPLTFERRLPLTAESLAKLAPAVERPGIHLGVWRDEAGFYVWGATRTLPALCFVLEVLDPGLLVIKHRRNQESGKFVNVAVLEGERIKMLDHKSVSLRDSPALVASLLGFEAPASSADSMNVLIQLAVSMRVHGRGGSLLIVPQGSEEWRESIIGLTPYAVSPPYSELADLMREDPAGRLQRRWQEALRRAIDAVAGLTAVDGAMVLNDQCELLAFGAKIGRREGWARIEQVVDTEPIEGALPRLVHPSQIGGTRHLSAAQFGHDQNDSVALVASQDGRFTVFAWSAPSRNVHAYRVEALLL